ncbi:hypothetical protein Tco_1325762, partial [Tanacetum coccineum]
VAQPQVNPDSTIAQAEQITPFTKCGTGVQRLYNMLRHVSLEGRLIVVLGLRGGILGANPIPHRDLGVCVFYHVKFGTGRAVWHRSCGLARVVQFGTGRAV